MKALKINSIDDHFDTVVYNFIKLLPQSDTSLIKSGKQPQVFFWIMWLPNSIFTNYSPLDNKKQSKTWKYV